jgi:hypothetical protein
MARGQRRFLEHVIGVRGTGLCGEAQADGVPCTRLWLDCESCERIYPPKKKGFELELENGARAPRG